MSKGGAGKVYFVLYLAVILELLIIIVERDEAEEHLMKKQQESMRIVESILTQLQSGAGTEGINTRPQDAIVISDELPEEQRKLFKKHRTYYIEVGVTDVASATNMEGMDEAQKKEKIETLKKLANVQELQYEIYFNPSKELNAPDSPPLAEFKKVEQSPQANMKLQNSANAASTESWELLATKKLELDTKTMKDYLDPLYNDSPIKAGNINEFAPPDSASVNRVFGYSKEKTDKLRQNGKLTKRAFVCNFQPNKGREGWYKLRFSSQTNRIMGISAEQKFNALKDDQKVNIGTVQLKVKDLRSVQRQLAEQLAGSGVPSFDAFANGSMKVEEFNSSLEAAKNKVNSEANAENSSQKASRIDLYGYIAKLLSPGQYTSFDQNRGSIEIDIFVQSPKIEEGKPDVVWLAPQAYTFDKAKNVTLKLNTNYFNKKRNDPVVTVKGTKYIAVKDTESPITGERGNWIVKIPIQLLAPGKDKDSFSVLATFGDNEKSKDTSSCIVTVFKTGLLKSAIDVNDVDSEESEDASSNSSAEVDFIKSLSKLSKGDELAFTAQPTSGVFIRPEEFTSYITGLNPEGQPERISGFVVKGKTIPLTTNKLYYKLVWRDPNNPSEEVVIFPLNSQTNEPQEFNIGTPKPIVKEGLLSSINDLTDPSFTVSVLIEGKKDRNGQIIPTEILTPKFQILPLVKNTGKSSKASTPVAKNSDFNGYSIDPVDSPKLVGGRYTQKFRVRGKAVKKSLKIAVKVKIKARAVVSGTESEDKSYTFSSEIRVSPDAK